MTRKSLALSAALLVALVVFSVLLNRGLVQGVVKNADIVLSTDAASFPSGYPSGQAVRFTATLNFATSTPEEVPTCCRRWRRALSPSSNG